MGNKKRVAKLLIILLIVCLVIVVLGYFLYTFLHTNDPGIKQSEFGGKLYASEDANFVLEFSDDATTARLRVDGAGSEVKRLSLTYEENLFTGTTETETYYFLVLGDGTLYCSIGNYLFQAQYAQ